MKFKIPVLEVNCTVICVVTNVNECEVFVDLPNNSRGIIPVDAISDIYSKKMSELLEKGCPQKILGLPSLFSPGDVLRGKITELSQNLFKLTINPREINGNLRLHHGMVIQGMVINDNYVDIGFTHVIGLLKSKMLSEFAFREFRVLLSSGLEKVNENISTVNLEVAYRGKNVFNVSSSSPIQAGMIVRYKQREGASVEFGGRKGMLVDATLESEKLVRVLYEVNSLYVLTAARHWIKYTPNIATDWTSTCRDPVISVCVTRTGELTYGRCEDYGVDVSFDEGEAAVGDVVRCVFKRANFFEKCWHVTRERLKTGSVVKAVIASISPTCVCVDVKNPNASGVIYSKYLEKGTYIVGSEIVCRVWSVEPALLLCNKRELMESELPQSFESVKIGHVYRGLVVSPKSVSLGGSVGGILLDVDCAIGDVVECTVVETKGRLKFLNSKHVDPLDWSRFTCGMLVDVQIVHKYETDLVGRITGTYLFVRVPMRHLSDCVEASLLIYGGCKPGDVLTGCRIFKLGNYPIVSRKPSFLSLSHVTTKFGDFQISQLYTGYVANIKSFGVFVEFPGGFTGLSPPQKLGNHTPTEFQDSFKLGQPVKAIVVDTQIENERLLLNLKMTDCCYVADDVQIGNLVDSAGQFCSACSAHKIAAKDGTVMSSKIGLIVGAKVRKNVETGVLYCRIAKGFYGYLVDGPEMEGISEVVMVGYDTAKSLVIVSSEKSLITGIRRGVKLCVDQIVQAKVLTILSDFAIVAITTDRMSTIGFISTKKCWNDFFSEIEFIPGQNFVAVVKRVSEDGHFGYCLPKERTLSRTRRPIKVGSHYSATVKSVERRQLVISVKGNLGRVHITQISDSVPLGKNPLSDYRVNQKVKVTVVSMHSKCFRRLKYSLQSNQSNCELIECTMRQCFEDDFKQGQCVDAFLDKFDGRHTMKVLISPKFPAKMDILQCSKNINIVNNPKSFFPYKCFRAYIIGRSDDCVELSVISNNLEYQFQPGQKVIGRIVKWNVEKSAWSVLLPNNTMFLSDGEYKKGEYVQFCYGGHNMQFIRACGSSDINERFSDSVKRKKSAITKETKRGKKQPVVPEFEWDEDIVCEKETEEELDPFAVPDEGEYTKRCEIKRRTPQSEGRRAIDVRATERKLIDDGYRQPETYEDFERIVYASPSSSIAWMRYIAFHLENSDLQNARAVGRRALKAISPSDEQEYFNVWVGILNMENMYGTETFDSSVAEAAQLNNPVKIFLQAASIMSNSGKTKEAEAYYFKALKKSSNSDLGVWLELVSFYYRNGLFDSGRKLIFRSANSVTSKQHVEILKRTAHHEYKFGDSEKGKSMFESLIATYPRRTDIWSIFVDVLVVAGQIEGARDVLNRSISLNLNPKKMQPLFRKFIEFEKVHGDEGKVNYVKMKASEFIDVKKLKL